MPIRRRGPAAVWFQPNDGSDPIRIDSMLSPLPDHPERGVPYSVSWYEGTRMVRCDRVYVIEHLVDPAGVRLLDATTGKVLDVWREHMPLFKPPTTPHPHRLAMQDTVKGSR